MSYYRMHRHSRAEIATARTRCDNCNRPLREHKLVAIDRDGELHECPRVSTSAKRSKKHAN